MYAAAAAIQNEVMRIKDVKQLLCETKAGFSTRVNELAYWCGNDFLLGYKMSTFVFGSNSTTQTIVADKIEKRDDKTRLFEYIIQIAQKR